ncbi:hypothetical protein RQP46_006644 [Phenoliferia psychrophenolica]
MSSNVAHTPRTTITSLPTELIVRIVRLSSPKPSWDDATERFKHLRNLALVCQALRAPAQEELFRHVVLRSVAASRAFVAVLKSRAGARFENTPRSLRAGTDGEKWIDQDKWALPDIVNRCWRLESMWLLRIGGVDVAALAASRPGLKELFCFECVLFSAYRMKVPKARSLRRLGLIDCTNTPSIQGTSFPNVTSLDMHTSLGYNDPGIGAMSFLYWYPSLENLEHFRCGADNLAGAREVLMAKELEDELKVLRPDVRLSFDEDHTRSRGPADPSIDAKFNPAFWAFVDDAEAAEAARRLEGT